MKPMPIGLHIVGKSRPGKPKLWYVYAWRGGPQIHVAQGAKPKITPAIADAAAEARKDMSRSPSDTLAGLIAAYRASPDFTGLAATTKASWNTWYGRIIEKFGDTPFAVLNDERFRGDVLEWRDEWAHQPRSADLCIQAFSRALSWGKERTKLKTNVLLGVPGLYDHDRSDIIWEAHHFEAFNKAALEAGQPEMVEAIELAACTGFRRGDLVALPLVAAKRHAIVWETAKSGKKVTAVVPRLPEFDALLTRIADRFEAEMQAKPKGKRKVRPDTILANSFWRSWTASGFGHTFNLLKKAAGIDVHLHDLRGTFATRLILAGLTDNEVGTIMGWTPGSVATIRAKYVDEARVVIAIGERIAAASVNQPVNRI